MVEATTTVTVNDRGRIVIPKPVRTKLSIEQGDVVELTVTTDD